MRAFKSPWTVLSVVTVAFGAGGGLGYILGSRRKRETLIITKPVNEQLELPLFEKKEGGGAHGKGITITNWGGSGGVEPPHGWQTVGGASAILHPAVAGGGSDRRPEEVTLKVIRNTDASDDWDYVKEEKNRNGDKPYVLHYDEFMNDEMNWPQSTLTYFAKDNILCDENDVPVYDHENVVGVLMFGHGSNDPNVVYIRNPKMKQEWEILFNPSSYEQEVLGLEVEDELKAKGFKHGAPRFKLE